MKLAIVAVAGLACSAISAPLDTNLVINASFENVDVFVPGPYSSVLLLDWYDAQFDDNDIFAYAYSTGYSGSNIPAGSGDYFYFGGVDSSPGELLIFQQFDVSGGDTGALIATGNAYFDVRAYFSGYLEQNDSNFVTAFFLDGGGNEIGSETIGGADFVLNLGITDGQRDWGEDRRGGLIPAGTQSVLIGIGASDSDAYHDGYVDLVDFQVTATRPPVPPSFFEILTPVAGTYTTDATVMIDWTDSGGADSYTVVVSANSDLSNPTISQSGLTASEYGAAGLDGGVYYVGVTATNPYGNRDAANNGVDFGLVAGGGGNDCIADLNNDGLLDFFDVQMYLNLYSAGCP